jgi:hypothetical protein
MCTQAEFSRHRHLSPTRIIEIRRIAQSVLCVRRWTLAPAPLPSHCRHSQPRRRRSHQPRGHPARISEECPANEHGLPTKPTMDPQPRGHPRPRQEGPADEHGLPKEHPNLVGVFAHARNAFFFTSPC